MPRPGYGIRHPEVDRVLAGAPDPIGVEEVTWPNDLPLRISGYLGLVDLPDALIISLRCLVWVGDKLVVCTNDDASHPWPGGRRQAGETYVDTAVREVYEETGWHLQRESVAHFGWLHLQHLRAQPDDYPWPHPDWFQVVLTGHAQRREREDWTDLDNGYERESHLLEPAAALRVVNGDLGAGFIRAALEARQRRSGAANPLPAPG